MGTKPQILAEKFVDVLAALRKQKWTQNIDVLRERLTVELGGREDDLELPQLDLLTSSLTISKIIV